MLDSLRNAAGTWVAKLLLLLLVLSFAVWGISGNIMGPGYGNAVLTAGNTEVSVNEYRLAYDRQVNVMSQNFGTRLTREQASALGIDNQVLAQLAAGAVLVEQAREMGLGLSKDRLAGLTAEDPAFRGLNGGFDRTQFDIVLRNAGMRPEDYLKNREQVAVRQQIIEAVSDGLEVPDTYLKAVAVYRGENRTVDFLTLPQSLIGEIETPQDSVLTTYFEQNKARYAAPEFRKISYVKLEPEDISDPAAVTDQQIREDFERNKSRYTTAEKRTIEQLVFKDTESAQAALDSIRGGATFEDTVTAQGKTLADVGLGTLEKSKISDSAVAEAAFSAEKNVISDVIQGAFGPVLLRVTEITPENVRDLKDVSDEIRNDIALAEANRILLDVHDSYEDARGGGETMQEAASKLGLEVVTIDAIDRTGKTPDGGIVETIPQSAQVIRGAFESSVDIENPPLGLGTGGFVWYELKQVTPARDRTLDEVRNKVIADWKKQQTEERLGAKATELQKKLDDGEPFDELAAGLNLEKQTKRGLKRNADDSDLGSSGVASAFGGPIGHTGIVTSPSGDAQVLFRVTEVFEPVGADADSVPETDREAFASAVADDLVDQLVSRLQSEYGVVVNNTAIQQALSF